MKTEITDVSQTRKELKIEIPAETVRAAYDEVSERYSKQASVPGFRKGRTPTSVVRQRFKNEIRGDVLQQLVPRAVNDAVMENGLAVVGEPDIHLDKFGEQPVSLHVHVGVLPQIALGNYKGLAAARRVRPVTDEGVEEVVQNLRESSASLQPVEERGAELGDTVTANVHGRFVNPPAEEDMNVEDVEVLLGGEGVIEDFNQNLLGARPDDVKTFTVNYPEDFSSKGLAGKEVEYTATVTAVRRKELPEVDDEWAQSLGEENIDTVEKLRERVRENLTDHAKYESDQRLRGEVMKSLLDAHQFEVPESLVEHQARRMVESTVRDMLQRGIDPRGGELNWEGLHGTMREQAGQDLRGSFLLEMIAEEEKIEVSEEEINAEIEALAQASRQSVEQVRATLTKQGGERSIADRLRHRKTLDMLVASARVSDEEWREEGPAAGARTGDAGDEGAEAAAGGERS
jgi:trigger factor